MGIPGIIVRGNGTAQTLTGTAGDDALMGTNAAEEFWSGIGDDDIIGGGGADYIYADLGDDFYDGGTGIDTINFLFVNIDGNATSYSSSFGINFDLAKNIQDLGYFGIKRIYDIESVVGTNVDDAIYGNDLGNVLDGQSGNDVLNGRLGKDSIAGGFGDDTIIGGGDDDVLWGGGNADRLYAGSGKDIVSGGQNQTITDDGASDAFIFTAISNSPSSTTRDSIYGFFDGATGDKIDLSRIDANGSAAGDGKFTFIGSNSIGADAVSQVQVRATGNANEYLVRIDIDGDVSAEMQLMVYSASAITSADFIL